MPRTHPEVVLHVLQGDVGHLAAVVGEAGQGGLVRAVAVAVVRAALGAVAQRAQLGVLLLCNQGASDGSLARGGGAKCEAVVL